MPNKGRVQTGIFDTGNMSNCTKEQRVVFFLACNVVAKRLPLRIASIASVLQQCGASLLAFEEMECSNETEDPESRLRKTTKLLEVLYEMLSTKNDGRKEHFDAFCSMMQEADPQSWHDLLPRIGIRQPFYSNLF